VAELLARGRALDTSRPLVMGILNRTTDSFFDHGTYYAFDQFLAKAEELVIAGADLLDVGGVKAGPGEEVTLEMELERVVPAVEALVSRFDAVISVDTWRSEVLEAALGAGAHVGNDISGFADPRYTTVAARFGAAVIATHIRLAPRVPDPNPVYADVVGEVCSFLANRAGRAIADGVDPRSVIVDAGYDLGKTTPQSLALLEATDRIAALGYPVLIACSNKGFLGETLGLEVSERRTISIAAACHAYLRGGRVFRMHDVRGAVKALDALRAILECE